MPEKKRSKNTAAKKVEEKKLKSKSDKNINFYVEEIDIRFGLVTFVVVLLFGYVLVYLWKLQIEKGEYYAGIKKEQHSAAKVDDSKRGIIYMTRKDGVLVPLANMVEGYKVVMSPQDIPLSYEERVRSALSPYIDLEKENFSLKIAKKKDPYEELGGVDKKTSDAIDAIGLVGISIQKFQKRVYPMGFVGAKVVGFTGDGEDGVRGRAGLEKYYDDVLSSRGGSVNNFFSSIFAELDNKSIEKPLLGQNIVTTIEPNVQQYLYQLLKDIQASWGSDSVAAIIMNPKTGEIVAMEGVPTFDPNKYKEFDVKTYINPNIQGVYEMGSIVKPLTMSIGIENKLITPQTYFRDTGFVELDGYTIKNFDGKIRGDVTMQTVLGQSLNTGVVYVMKLLGKERFREGMIKFGIEEETGIDLPGELSNKTTNLHTGPLVNYATSAFGQGIAFTPISTLHSLSALVNNGQLVSPYVVSKKVTSEGFETSMVPTETQLAISEETAETMRQMLIHNIDVDYGNGKYKDSHYAVGAKTGTAQLTKEHGGYYDDRFLHSYFMFVGSGDQEFAVLIFQVNPKKGVLASIALTPFADKLKNFLIAYYNIKPDRQI
jgi:stage V sporulation protein D (sporulation-specific penicillin-binding protein)